MTVTTMALHDRHHGILSLAGAALQGCCRRGCGAAATVCDRAGPLKVRRRPSAFACCSPTMTGPTAAQVVELRRLLQSQDLEQGRRFRLSSCFCNQHDTIAACLIMGISRSSPDRWASKSHETVRHRGMKEVMDDWVSSLVHPFVSITHLTQGLQRSGQIGRLPLPPASAECASAVTDAAAAPAAEPAAAPDPAAPDPAPAAPAAHATAVAAVPAASVFDI